MRILKYMLFNKETKKFSGFTDRPEDSIFLECIELTEEECKEFFKYFDNTDKIFVLKDNVVAVQDVNTGNYVVTVDITERRKK